MSIKTTDAVILMQFRDAVAHLKGHPLPTIQGQMKALGQPYLDRLKANGHDWTDAVALMRETWNTIEEARS